jgi:hypothetical protein
MPILVPKIMPKLFPFVPKFGFICFGFVSLFSVLNIHYFLFVWLFSMFSDGFCSFCMLAGLVCMFSIVCYLVSVAVIRFQLLILVFPLFIAVFPVWFLISFHAALYGACILLLSARSHLILSFLSRFYANLFKFPYGNAVGSTRSHLAYAKPFKLSKSVLLFRSLFKLFRVFLKSAQKPKNVIKSPKLNLKSKEH